MSSPTIYDIAARAGVGIATVSRVINGSRRVSDKTRETVQKAMNDLGFRPNHAARRLASGTPNRPRTVALMPFFTTAFYFTVCKALSKALSSSDIDLVLVDVQDQNDADRHLDRLIAERSCEAVVVCSMDISDERRDQFEILKIPVVALDYDTKAIPHVRVDNIEGGRLLAQHLTACGCQKQALIIGTRAAHAFRDREIGYLEVCPAGSQVYESEAVDVEHGMAMAERVLREVPDIQGIACAGDALAVGVLQKLRELGKRVPDDIQVIGFDDQPLMDVLGISTVHQPMSEFGEWAAEVVVKLIKEPAAPAPDSEVLALTLIPRLTTLEATGKAAQDRASA